MNESRLPSPETLMQELKQLRAENAQLRDELERTQRDQLTGWFKEEPAKKQLMRMVEEDPTLIDKPISVISIDLNNLKQVNNQYSHDTGNELIKAFVAFINGFSEAERSEGIILIPFRRFDRGDEFDIICLGVGYQQIERIRLLIERRVVLVPGTENVKVEFTMGTASSDEVPAKEEIETLKERFLEPKEQAAEILHLVVSDAREQERIAERKKKEAHG